jgi:hypothetical protein
MEKKDPPQPLNEGQTRGNIKGDIEKYGSSKPQPSPNDKANSAPPPPPPPPKNSGK